MISPSVLIELLSPKNVIMVLFLFVGSYLTTQQWLSDDKNLQSTVAYVESGVHEMCRQGIRVPGMSCPLQGAKLFDASNNLPLRYQFSQIPTLKGAIDMLNWRNGQEVDAVKLLTIFHALRRSRRSELRDDGVEGTSTRFLQQIWAAYPELVIASNCYYCEGHSHFIRDQLQGLTQMPPSLTGFYQFNPEYLGIANEAGMFDAEQIHKLALMHAELSFASDWISATSVGDILIQHREFEALKHWTTSGALNAGRTLDNTKLADLPLDLVIASWEQGISIAYDQPRLTSYLMSQGYRPALRWAIWFLSVDIPLLSSMDGKEGKYSAMISRFTDFPASSGYKLAKHYSDNWQQIVFDSEQKKWVSTGKLVVAR